ncbi:MAG: hypothetical protein NTV32_09105 [Gammaproteobacteria bacterium]|nr:hypothetical protein [Gammaproteobacteria bacterium]
MKIILMFCALCAFSATAYAADDSGDTNLTSMAKDPLYFGFMTGYGNTDWGELVEQGDLAATCGQVPDFLKPNLCNNTPSSASGSGAIVGAMLGFQFNPYLAIEGQYIRYPDSSVNFGTPNPYGGLTHITAKTNYFALMGKVEAPFYHDDFEAFGTLGIADVESSSPLADSSNVRPTFGFGVSDIQLARWIFSLAFNYTPGTGTASTTTADQYIPYIYSGQLSVAYRI